MAKKSAVEKNKNRLEKINKYANRRARLKEIATNRSASAEEIFEAHMKLAQLPRNSARIRYRNRCLLSGRPRATYRKFKLSRIALRDLASEGQIPGVVKASW